MVELPKLWPGGSFQYEYGVWYKRYRFYSLLA